MKSRNDPRHQHRESLIQKLFEWDFRKTEELPPAVEAIVSKMDSIDAYIRESAPMWPLEQIAFVDLAILRLAVWELFYRDEPLSEKVILDESIELAKEYGGEASPSFINGVLGGVLLKHPREPISEEKTASEEKPIQATEMPIVNSSDDSDPEEQV